MILLGRLEVFNISASRFFLFSLPFSYSNFKNGRLSGASFQHNSLNDQYKSGDSQSCVKVNFRGFIHVQVYCPQEDTFAGFSQLLPDRLVLRASNVRGLAVLPGST